MLFQHLTYSQLFKPSECPSKNLELDGGYQASKNKHTLKNNGKNCKITARRNFFNVILQVFDLLRVPRMDIDKDKD